MVLSTETLMGVTNHMGGELFPRWPENGLARRGFITVRYHQQHHSNYRYKYGLYFLYPDRYCKTNQDLGTFGDHLHRDDSPDGRITRRHS